MCERVCLRAIMSTQESEIYFCDRSKIVDASVKEKCRKRPQAMPQMQAKGGQSECGATEGTANESSSGIRHNCAAFGSHSESQRIDGVQKQCRHVRDSPSCASCNYAMDRKNKRKKGRAFCVTWAGECECGAASAK